MISILFEKDKDNIYHKYFEIHDTNVRLKMNNDKMTKNLAKLFNIYHSKKFTNDGCINLNFYDKSSLEKERS